MAKRRSRAKLIIGSALVVVLAAGGGVAWAATRSSGPSYRLASVTRGNVSQTVTEVGTISSADQATLSFPVSGTVASVPVHTGDTIAAGHTVATLDTGSLQSAVESAKSSVADAEQRLASDQDSETSTTSTTSADTTDDTTNSVREVALVTPTSGPTPSPSPTSSPSHGGGSTGGSGGSGGGSVAQAKVAVTKAQHAVVSAQSKVDALLTGPASAATPHVLSVDLAASKSACASTTSAITTKYAAGGTIDGTVSGANDGLAVTLTGTDANGAPITMSATVTDGGFHFDGLQGVQAYQISIGNEKSGVTFVDSCTTALAQVQQDETAVANAESDLNHALGSLNDAVAAFLKAVQSSGSSTGSGPGPGTGTGSGSGSGGGTRTGGSSGAPQGGRSTSAGGTGGTRSGSGGSSTGVTGGSSGGVSRGSAGTTGGVSTPITAEQIAADQKAIDAANAELAVAHQNRAQAVLTTPIAGTVAAVAITAGTSVSAGSSSATITVIGHGQKQITTTVGIADIDLVKKGDRATITVDGVSSTLSGTVSLIGIMNTSGTSGTTTTYPVTVTLDKTARTLYDGAGATVVIKVGTKRNVLTVPASAVHASVIGSSVEVYSGGKVTATRVQVGVRGLDATEITAGLKAGDRVVLAVVSDPVPNSNSNTTNRGGAGVLGGTGGGGRFVRGGAGVP